MARRLVPDQLRAARKARSLTALRLAAEIGVSEVTVRTWESGRYNPSQENLEHLARALGVTLEDISTEEPECTHHRSRQSAPTMTAQAWPLWIRETLTSKDPGNFHDHVRHHPVVGWAGDDSAGGALVPVVARMDRGGAVVFTPEPPDPSAWDYAVELVTDAGLDSVPSSR